MVTREETVALWETAAYRENCGLEWKQRPQLHSFFHHSFVRDPAVQGAHGRGGRGGCGGVCGGEGEHFSVLNVIVGVQAADDANGRERQRRGLAALALTSDRNASLRRRLWPAVMSLACRRHAASGSCRRRPRSPRRRPPCTPPPPASGSHF